MADGVIKILIKDATALGIKSVEASLKGLEKVASKVGSGLKVVGGALGIAGAAGGIELIKASTQEYMNAEKVNIALAQSLLNNNQLTKESYSSFVALAGQIQKTSIYEDDLVKSQMQQAASMGLTQEQIESLSRAAADYASGTGKSYEEAFQTLQKTFSGTAGTLGKADGAIKKLTQSQLKHGDAVKIVAEKYKGMAQAIASSSVGKIEQLKNLWSDTLETLGKPLTNIGLELLKGAQPALDKISVWLEDNTSNITAFLLSLPEFITNALKFVPAFFEFLTDGSMWGQLFLSFGQAGIEATKDMAKIAWNWILTLGKTTWNTIADFILNSINTLKSTLSNLLNDTIIKSLNGMIETINKALSILPGGNKLEIKKIEEIKLSGATSNLAGGNAKLWADNATEQTKLLKDMASVWGDFGDVLPESWNKKFGPLMDEFKKIFNKNLKKAEQATDIAQKILDGKSDEKTTIPIIVNDMISSMTDILKNFGVDLSPVTSIQTLFTQLSSFATSLGSSGEGLTAILGTLATVVGGVVSALGAWLIPIIIAVAGLLSTIMTPLFGILQPIIKMLYWVGQWLGTLLLPIFDALSPIFYLLAEVAMALVTPLITMLVPYIQIICGILNDIVIPIIKAIAIAIAFLTIPVEFVADLLTWFGNQIQAVGKWIQSVINNPLNSGKWDTSGFYGFSFADESRKVWSEFTKTAAALTASTARTQYGSDLSTFTQAMTDSQAALLAASVPSSTDSSSTSGSSASYATTDTYNTYNITNTAPIIGTSLDNLVNLIADRLTVIEKKAYSKA